MSIEAGKAFVRILARDETKGVLKQIGARFKAMGVGLAAVGAAGIAGASATITALGAAVSKFTQVGSDLTDMSARTGIAASALSELAFAAGQGGASMGDLEMALKHMAKTTGKSSVEALLAQAEAISKIEDPGKRAQAAIQAFGRSGTKLLPVLEGGADGIQKMTEQARLMGLTMSDEDAAAADKLGDSMGQLKATFGAIVNQVGAAIAPFAQFAVDGLQMVASSIVLVVKAVRPMIAGLSEGLSVIKTAFSGISEALAMGDLALAGRVAMAALNVAWAAGVHTLMTAWARFADYFIDTIAGAVRKATEAFDGFVSGSMAGINFLLKQRGLPMVAAPGPMGGPAADMVGGFAAALKGGNKANATKAMEDLQKAIDAWRETVTEAEDKKKAFDEEARKKPPPLPALKEIAKPIQAMASGTFSGFAAGRLGQAGGVIEELRKLGGKLDDIKDSIDDIDPLAFT